MVSAEQVYEYGYDGLFVDSAAHILQEEILRGPLPDDYTDEDWARNRAASLAFVKEQFPDKGVGFNGLHNGAGAEESLSLVDGAMWETFCYFPVTGRYAGTLRWLEALSLAERNREERVISLVGKKAGLTENIQARFFLTASYLLVSHRNVVFSLIDLNDKIDTALFYYPEFSLNLGQPLGDFVMHEDTYATRDFEHGRVVVNPLEDISVSYELDESMESALPAGGGLVEEDGYWEGAIEYELLSGSVELPPVSALLLLYP